MGGPVKEPLDRPVKISAAEGDHYDRSIDVVFVCTGNICRSPMAEGLLRARLTEVAPDVVIGSTGLLFEGREAEPGAISALERRGIDLHGHAARTLTLEDLEPASLILGMERRHVHAVVEVSNELVNRSFTLPEFIQQASLVGPRPADEPLRAWVERVGANRSLDGYLRPDPATSIADPMGRSRRVFRACADEIDGYLADLVALAWPGPGTRDASSERATTGGTP